MSEVDPVETGTHVAPARTGRTRVRAHLGLVPGDRPILHQFGLAAWSLIGIFVLVGAVVVGLATISSVVLPLLFAAVMAVLFRPLAVRLTRARIPEALAAGLVVLVLVAVIAGVATLAVRGIVDQGDDLLDEIDAALVELGIDDDDIADVRKRIEDLDPSVTSGLARSVASGLSVLGEVLVGALLGVLIMYYLIKDGDLLRRKLVAKVPERHARNLDEFIGETCFVLRRYWLGRSIVSAIVAAVVGIAALLLDLPLVPTLVVVTFVGGFVPYLGAVVGGLLAVVLGLATGGLVDAGIMLVTVLFANLVVENAVEPYVTGRTLQIHPLIVLLATTVGGILGGLAGLVMAVPLTVIAGRALPRLARALDLADEPESTSG